MKLILIDATHTEILAGLVAFAIALAVLLGFVVWPVVSYRVSMWRDELASYWSATRAQSRMNRMLRDNGFTQVKRGDWRK